MDLGRGENSLAGRIGRAVALLDREQLVISKAD